MSEFNEQMSKLSTDELMSIVYIYPFKYQDSAIIAAEIELNNRNISEFDSFKAELISKYYEDLSELTDDELMKYAIQLSLKHNKGDREVIHILKMGNIDKKRAEDIANNFKTNVKEEKSLNRDRNRIIGLASIFIGITLTILSLNSASTTGGTSYIFYGLIIFGIIKLLNLF